jgi:hypothetical protein
MNAYSMNEPQLRRIEERLAEHDRIIQQLQQQLRAVVADAPKTVVDTFVQAIGGAAPAIPNRCKKCGVPLESYQAYSCEDVQCPRPRTLA